MNRELFWRILFYVSWGTVALWVLLKSIGVIKTPFWLEFGVPAAGVVVGIFAVYHNIMENITKLAVGFATLSAKVENLDRDMEFVKKRLA